MLDARAAIAAAANHGRTGDVADVALVYHDPGCST